MQTIPPGKTYEFRPTALDPDGDVLTYSIAGKQYIIVAVSGGPYSGEYIAFTLP